LAKPTLGRIRVVLSRGRKGRYRIDGSAFLYSDLETGRTTTILGYPTDKLTQTV
jgi:hypothetical protein